MANYSTVPATATVQPTPFTAHVSDQKLKHFKDLLALSPIGPPVYENTHAGRQYGMTREWLSDAKQIWETTFDWRAWEARINSYPNFTMPITHRGVTIDVHFLALFSTKRDAIPIAFYHGWPGSFLEFLQILDILKNKYPDPKDLPWHVVVPSLPGYAYSSGPPVETNYDAEQAAECLDQVMQNLGFTAYIAQGGDIGSTIAKLQAAKSSACKGAHINMAAMAVPENEDELHVDEVEKMAMDRATKFKDNGMAYFFEHGTRTATIGLALSASPLAMLSWIGEKFLEWTDEDPKLEEILASVTLYWMTDCYPRCIYPYRALGRRENPRIEKPCGYSLFPYDIASVPRSWMETKMNLVHYSQHKRGGHFAAMEKPHELLADVEEYLKKAWKGSKL